MSEILQISVLISSVLLIAAMAITVYKILSQSSNLEKVVALEVLANTLVGIIALWALQQNLKLFIDITIAIALIMFLSTVAYLKAIIIKRN